MSFKVGQQVLFGQPNGSKTKGEILKINRVAVKIKQLEERNSKPIGTIWRVPMSLIYELDSPNQPIVPRQTLPPHMVHTDEPSNEMPSKFWIMQHYHEIHLLNAVYADLSPENLSCDGELGITEVRAKRARLNARMNLITNLMGRTMAEEIAWECLKVIESNKTQTA